MSHKTHDSSAFSNNRILWHVLFWFGVVSYFTIGYARNNQFLLELTRSLAFLPTHMFLVYVFLYLLIPYYLLPRKFLLFFILSVLVYAMAMYFSFFINF